MEKNGQLLIFGDSAFAEIAYEYFTHDSPFTVVAFTVDKEFITKPTLFGLPIVPFEEVETLYPPTQYAMHVALTYAKLNRIRQQKYLAAKAKGYTLPNYVSSRSFVWHNVQLGDNNFIFEDNTIQPFVTIGSNNVFWSGNHIGHHSTLGSNNFISSHVVISGFCTVGDSNFIGVNATLGNNLNIGSDCLIGSAVHMVKDVPDKSLMKGTPNSIDPVDTHTKFGIA